MKSILVLVGFLALQNGAFSQHFKLPSEIVIPSTKVWLVETFTNAFTSRLIRQMKINQNPKIGFTLLPPIEDPLTVEPADLPLNITFDVNGYPVSIYGDFNLTEQSEVTGLSGLIDELEILTPVLRPLEFKLTIRLPSVAITGKHSLEINLDLGTTKTIAGAGDLDASVSDVFVTAHAVSKLVGGFLGISSVDFDIGFQNLHIDGGVVSIDDVEVDWERVSESIQTLFDTTWNEESKAIVDQLLLCALDNVLSGCTIADITGGNLECLSLDPVKLEECIRAITAPPQPTRTTQSVPTTQQSGATNDPNPTTTGATNGPNPTTPGATNGPTTQPPVTTGPPATTEGNEPTATTQTPAPGDDSTPAPTTAAPTTAAPPATTPPAGGGAMKSILSPAILFTSIILSIIKFY